MNLPEKSNYITQRSYQERRRRHLRRNLVSMSGPGMIRVTRSTINNPYLHLCIGARSMHKKTLPSNTLIPMVMEGSKQTVAYFLAAPKYLITISAVLLHYPSCPLTRQINTGLYDPILITNICFPVSPSDVSVCSRRKQRAIAILPVSGHRVPQVGQCGLCCNCYSIIPPIVFQL